MIDFHCHLDLYPNYRSIVEACRVSNIYVLAVTTTPSAWRGTRALVQDCERVRPALGLHPELAHQRKCELPLFCDFLPEAQYIGEIGLDGSKHLQPFQSDQRLVLEVALRALSRAGGRIMSIHSRRAVDPVLDMLKLHDAGIPVMHWFSGSKAQLKRAIAAGCWFSVGPAMLGSKSGRELVASMPKDRILTETDGPFARVKGRVLTPTDTALAIEGLATIWGEPLDLAKERLKNSLKSLLCLAGAMRLGAFTVAVQSPAAIRATPSHECK